jgi:hypothetical protein
LDDSIGANDLWNITTESIRRKVIFFRRCNESSSLLLTALIDFKIPSFFHHFSPSFRIYWEVEEWTCQGKHVGISVPDLLLCNHGNIIVYNPKQGYHLSRHRRPPEEFMYVICSNFSEIFIKITKIFLEYSVSKDTPEL